MRFLALLTVCLALLTAPSLCGRWDDPEAGLPVLRKPPDHESFDPYFLSAVVDRRGRLYCSADHVYEYDAETWSIIRVGEGNTTYALALDETNRIWCGGVNELGYLDEDESGTRTFHSLRSYLPAEAEAIHVWDVCRLKERTLFVCDDSLLIWDGVRFEFRPMPVPHRLFSFTFGGSFYVSQPGTGLWRWDGVSLSPVRLGGLELTTIQAAWRDSEHHAVFLASNCLVRVRSDQAEPFAHDLIAQIRPHRISSATQLPDGPVAVQTVTAGIFIITAEGEILRRVDRRDGLPTLYINKIALGPSGRAWVTHDVGVLEMDTRHRQTLFNEVNSPGGNGFTVAESADSGTLALTGEGIGRLTTGDSIAASLQRLPFLRGAYRDLCVLADGTVVAAGMREFLKMLPDRASPLIETSGNMGRIVQLTPDRPLLAVTESQRIAILDLTKAQPREKPIDGFPDGINQLAVDDQGTLWAGLRRDGIYAIDLSDAASPAKRHLAPGVDLPKPFDDPGLFVLGGETYAYTSQGIFTLPRTAAETARLAFSDTGLIAAERTGKDELWAVASLPGREPRLVQIRRDSHGELDVRVTDQVIRFDGRVLSVSRTREHILWVGGHGGFIRIDAREIENEPAPQAPLMQAAVWRAGDEVTRLPLAMVPTLQFRRTGTIEFQLRDSGDPLAETQMIETRLSGSANDWRLTGKSRTIDGLDEGRYTLEARVVGFLGNSGPVVSYAFTITPPWFRTPLAYLGYVLAFSGSIVGAAQWRTRRIRRQNTQLEQLVARRTEELAQAVSARSAFLANMGHEIRNPLNGVVGLVDTLRSETLTSRQKGIVDRVGTCADQLISVIDDVLEYARIDAGRIALRNRAFAVREPVEAAIDIFNAARPDVTIDLQAETGDLAAHIVGDPDRIRHILVNYLANALKFGGGTPVTVSIRRDRALLVFSVTDRGPGITPEEQARLFVRFSRGSLAYKNAIPGTGLGLAACKAYAEAMGGDVSVESELGHGATFFLRIPFHATSPEAAREVRTSPSVLVGRHALVVDDQDFNRFVLCDLLGRMGASASQASNIEEAREAFRAHVPDFVFVDFDLAGATGADLTEWIRKEAPAGRDVPVVATTAFEVDEVRRRCEEAGMDGFLAKPVTAPRLAEVVTHIEAVRSGSGTVMEPPNPGTAPNTSSFLDILAGGDPAKRREIERSTWGEVLTEALAAHRALRRGDAPITARHAHRLVSAALILGNRELVATARELNTVSKAGDLSASSHVAARLRRHIRDARRGKQE